MQFDFYCLTKISQNFMKLLTYRVHLFLVLFNNKEVCKLKDTKIINIINLKNLQRV